MKNKSIKSISIKVMHKAVVCFMMALALVPLYFLLVTALSKKSWKHLFIPQFYLKNFADAWEKAFMGQAFMNSTILTVCSLVLVVFFTASAGYCFARSKSRFLKGAFLLILFSIMIPSVINTVPLYMLMRKINGINTYWGMILLLTTYYLPFATFLYTNFIKEISTEMEEAAYIDGCSKFSAFWRVVFPTLKPVTATIIILDAVGIWNNYSLAVFFLQKKEMETVPLAISRFANSYGADWEQMGAAAIMGLVPPMIIFFTFQRYFIKGITAGGLKG